MKSNELIDLKTNWMILSPLEQTFVFIIKNIIPKRHISWLPTSLLNSNESQSNDQKKPGF